ncbi:hypothetical protein ADICYQ_2307 [Cyclobacterium qasimii M12-11B]|uniref:Uncharacterized protein n=2 Tax=Cyclobacterium qasimii TaxID=1350429 RepID=S7VF90_9BACT|nr:hypothetical protein ADICYQ_2307 [Cyclobacterium qasimii M12-11B]
MKVLISNILNLFMLAIAGCSTGNNPHNKDFVVVKINLDSLEQTRKDNPLPPIAIYSDYNFLLLDSLKYPLFFKTTGWFDDPNAIIMDKNYLSQLDLEIRTIKDVRDCIDSLISVHKIHESKPNSELQISIISESDTIKREEFFVIHEILKSNNVKVIVRELHDFEKQNLDHRIKIKKITKSENLGFRFVEL